MDNEALFLVRFADLFASSTTSFATFSGLFTRDSLFEDDDSVLETRRGEDEDVVLRLLFGLSPLDGGEDAFLLRLSSGVFFGDFSSLFLSDEGDLLDDEALFRVCRGDGVFVGVAVLLRLLVGVSDDSL